MAENILARMAPSRRPMGGNNLLAQQGYTVPDALPATPSRDVLTMPTPQRGNELRDYGHNLLAQMAGDAPAGSAANIVMGMTGPATMNVRRLPMDAASRAARAADQGYTIQAYKGMYPETGHSLVREGGQWVERGQRRPITEFANPDSPYAGFFSDTPAVADRFASHMGSGGAVYPAQLRFQNPVVIDAGGRPAAAFQFDAVARQHGTMDDMARFRGAFADGSGADGVILRNTADEGTVYVPRTPQQARSRFAAFDPTQRDNPDMLASYLLGAVGLGAAAGDQ